MKEEIVMSDNDKIIGTNYSLKNGIVEFFGAVGTRSDSGEWYANLFIGNRDLRFNIRKTDTLLDDILGAIATDIKAGNDVSYLIAGRRAGVLLYLSDIITAKHLRYASEGRGYVDIPGFAAFGDYSLTIRIESDKPEHYLATADKDYVAIK